MEIDETLSAALEAVDRRLAVKEATLAELELQSAQLRKLAEDEENFVRRLRSFVTDAEAERARLNREFRRLVATS